MTEPLSIYLTQDDCDRLSNLLEAYAAGSAVVALTLSKTSWLGHLVPPEQIPKDVMTMNSRVVFEDETTGERREVTLVYPDTPTSARARFRSWFRSAARCWDCVSDSRLTGTCRTAAAPLSRHRGAVPTGSGGRPGLTSFRAINRKGTTRWSG